MCFGVERDVRANPRPDGSSAARRWRHGAAWLGLLLVAALTVLAGPRPVLAADTPSVTGLRLGVHATHTRFVVDLTADVAFNVFLLEAPYRVVIDVDEVSFDMPRAGSDRKVGLVESYRYGLFRPGQSRIVLDVARPVVVDRAFLLSPRDGHGPRLVIDLVSADPATFREAMVKTAPTHLAAPAPAPSQPAAGDLPRRADGKTVVVVDAGHGGVDPGAISAIGIYEKEVTLDVVRRVARLFEGDPDIHLVLTRDRDVYLPLRERVAIARRAGAELFVSVHADSFRDPRVRGASVYTLSEVASDKEAELLAQKENRADIIAGVDLETENDLVTSILIDLAQRETMNLSAGFANVLIPELQRHIRLRSRPHRFAGFAVLKAPDVPSVLVELGYLSNKTEARFLASNDGKARMASALAEGIRTYVQGRRL